MARGVNKGGKVVNPYGKKGAPYGTMGYGDQRPLKQGSKGGKNFARAGTLKENGK